MPAEIDRQAIVDGEHLKLLYWGYIISGAFTAIFSVLGLFYAAMGGLMGIAIAQSAEAASKSGGSPPAFVGALLAAFGLAFFVVGATVTILKFVTARNLSRRKSRTFCMVIAGLTCLGIPYGTLLGIMTFIVLGRESVAKLFASNAAGSTPAS